MRADVCWRVGVVLGWLLTAGPVAGAEVQLTLHDCRARVLANSPVLAAAVADSAAAAGAARQAGAVPNPELSFEVENFGGDLAQWGEAEVTWSLAQNLGFLARRGAAAEAGRRGREAAAAGLAAARRDLLGEVERRFVAQLVAQRRMELLNGEVAVADSLTAAVGALVRAGEVSPVELSRARGERALAAIDRDAAVAGTRRAGTAMAELWGGAEGDSTRAAGELVTGIAAPTRAEVAAWTAANPELARQEAVVARQAALARLARAGRWPDPTAAGGVRRFAASGERAFVASVALPLPLFDRGGGAVAEAAAREAQARHELRALGDRLRAARLAAWDDLDAAIAAERVLRETVVPEAARVRAALDEGYRRGKFGLLDALDARRTLAAARLRQLEALAALHAARLELESLLGTPLAAPGGETP